MEVLLDLASKYKFKRLATTLKYPIVFHCVPGAGKSSLIREALNSSPKFVAFTFGEADTPNLTGNFIKAAPWSSSEIEGKYLLVDEYTESSESLNAAFAVFGDPLQTTTKQILRAHFTCNITRRFGKCTAELLRELGYDIESTLEDSVQISGIFELEPTGVIICHEEEVAKLLCAHSVEYKRVEEIRGKTFEEVTYITAENGPVDRVASFQCMTRHRTSLKILCPDASYTTS